jgi:retrograde regulation protein 2
LTVEILAKEEEGRVGAFGIASGFSNMQGIAMDLGGGSTQITWMISHQGAVQSSPRGAFSFPYGAAALTRKLADLKSGKSEDEAKRATNKFRHEMKKNFIDAYHQIDIPKELVERAQKEGGFPLYLSGGGFRGWGYLLLYQSQVKGHHYPISLINGFSAQKVQFENTEALKKVARDSRRIFRVSDRRRSQVPAVAFLIKGWLKRCLMASKKRISVKEEFAKEYYFRSSRLVYAARIRSRLQLPLMHGLL